MRALSATVLTLLFAIGCSSESESSSGGEGGSVPFEGPRGAVNMEVYASEAQTCPPGNLHVDMGNPRTDPPLQVEDGRGGATVACTVSHSGSQYAANGTITKGDASFSFSDVVIDDDLPSALGMVAFVDADGVQYQSQSAKPCVFQFAPQTEQGVVAGRIFVQFDCTSLVSAADPANDCSSRYGYVLVQGCEKNAP